ncbi:hypothetical protein [Halogeometricum limi]|uniref:hypothetical protein n=1 Tax=Halogeometricum limi TaxID=555875 RepID=UPI000B7F6C09|nr:hypothetical protein [Halogeometricum limi]
MIRLPPFTAHARSSFGITGDQPVPLFRWESAACETTAGKEAMSLDGELGAFCPHATTLDVGLRPTRCRDGVSNVILC